MLAGVHRRLTSEGESDLPQIIWILQQPADWLVIEPLAKDTSNRLIEAPKYNKNGKSIELADAIHIATAMQRGPGVLLATHDTALTLAA
jgi:hypothetical protein